MLYPFNRNKKYLIEEVEITKRQIEVYQNENCKKHSNTEKNKKTEINYPTKVNKKR